MAKNLRNILVLLLLSFVAILPCVTNANTPLIPKYAGIQEDIQPDVTEVVPLIQEITERKFTKIPQIEVVEPKEVIPVIEPEIQQQIKSMDPTKDEEQVKKESQQEAEMTSKNALGLYCPLDGKIYLMPDNLWKISNSNSILKMVITHELVHALQDQIIDLKKSLSISNSDENTAFAATIEGHADFVMQMIGYKLGVKNYLEEFHLIATQNQVDVNPDIYFDGERFILYHYEHGGNQRLWEILANPPTKTSMIFHPETYSHSPEIKLDYGGLLTNIKESFKKDWSVENVELGSYALLDEYSDFNSKDKQELVESIQHDQTLIAKKSEGESYFRVSFIIFSDTKQAARYNELMLKRVKKLDQKLWGGVYRKLKTTELTQIKADFAQKTVLIVRSDFIPGMTFVDVRIGRGNLVTHFQLFENDKEPKILEDSKIVEYAESVFSEYDKMIASK